MTVVISVVRSAATVNRSDVASANRMHGLIGGVAALLLVRSAGDLPGRSWMLWFSRSFAANGLAPAWS
jgi:hypothetical protein